jgi:hypothetical protein
MNRTHFSEHKREYIVFCRPVADISVRFGESQLAFTPRHCYLGVWWDHALSSVQFSSHLFFSSFFPLRARECTIRFSFIKTFAKNREISEKCERKKRREMRMAHKA